MNKIVMIYSSGDNCTYWCENVLPIIHESPESAYCDFCEKFDIAKKEYAVEEKKRIDWYEKERNLRPKYGKLASEEYKLFIKNIPTYVNKSTFLFAGIRFSVDAFSDDENMPRFLTIDEWFEEQRYEQ